jgi:hypothetical protein
MARVALARATTMMMTAASLARAMAKVDQARVTTTTTAMTIATAVVREATIVFAAVAMADPSTFLAGEREGCTPCLQQSFKSNVGHKSH